MKAIETKSNKNILHFIPKNAWLKVKKRLRDNFKNTLLSYSAVIIQIAIGIFTAPIFAQNLSPTDYSIVSYYNSLVLFLYPVLHLSFGNYYSVMFHKKSEEERKRLLFNLVVFLSVFDIVLLVISYYIFVLYFNVAHVSFDLTPYIFIVLAQIYFFVWFVFQQTHYRMKREFLKYFLITTLKNVSSIGSALVLVALYKMGATGRLLGGTIGTFLAGVVSISLLRSKMQPTFDFQIIKDALKFCGPLILSGLVIIPFRALDGILLEKKHDVDSFSLYSIGKNHANYIYVFGTSIYQAFETELFLNIHNKARKQMYINMFIMSVLLLAPTALYIIFAKPIANYLTSGRYVDAYYYGRIHAIGFFFVNVSVFIRTVVMGKQKSSMYFFINLTGALASIVLYNIMITFFGFTGAAITRSLVPITMIMFVVIYYMIKWKKAKSKSKRPV